LKATTHRGEIIRGWSASGDLFGSLLAGLLIGLALDAWLNTSPGFVIGFVIVAAIGAFRKMYVASATIEDQAQDLMRKLRGS